MIVCGWPEVSESVLELLATETNTDSLFIEVNYFNKKNFNNSLCTQYTLQKQAAVVHEEHYPHEQNKFVM